MAENRIGEISALRYVANAMNVPTLTVSRRTNGPPTSNRPTDAIDGTAVSIGAHLAVSLTFRILLE